MSNIKITALTADTAPTSDDLIVTVNDPAGTPVNKKVTLANAITKAHGISDTGALVVSSGVITAPTGTPTGAKFLRDDGSWQTVGGGGDALVSNPLSQFAATTSLQLKNTISDETGSGALPFATGPTLSLPVIDNVKLGYTTTATAAGTTTLTSASNLNQYFTGSTTQTVVLPVTSTLVLGQQYIITNLSTGVVTVQSSGANNIIAMVANSVAVFTVVSTSGTTAASWDGEYTGFPSVTGTGSAVLATSPTIVTPTIASLTNAQHDHSNAAGGGNIPESSVTGLVTDLSNKQPLDSDLTTIAALTATTDSFIQSKASAWSSRTPTQVTADLIAMVGDSGSGGTKGLVPAPGTGDAAAGKFLKADGTFAVPSGGGQTVVTKIVAASGGDYTTVGAAIAAASAGWVILVQPGTYTETTITSSLANITVVGLSKVDCIIDINSTTWTMSGDRFVLQGIKLIKTTGKLVCSGTNAVLDDVWARSTGSSNFITMSNSNGVMSNCDIVETTTNNTDYCIKWTAAAGLMVNCSTHTRPGSGFESLYTSGEMSFVGNRFDLDAVGGSSSVTLYVNSNSSVVTGNKFSNASNATTAHIHLKVNGSKNIISGNNIVGTLYGIANIGGSNNQYIGNFIYTANAASCIGFQSSLGALHVIEGNNFQSDTQTTSKAITISANSVHMISGNQMSFWGTGIELTSGRAHCSIIGNSIDQCTTPISDTNETTLIRANYGVDLSTERILVTMKNTSGGTLAVGDVVILKSVAAGNEFTTTTTASDNAILGMVCESIANNASGSILIQGKTASLKADGTTDIAVGDFLTTFTSAGISRKATTGTLGTTPGDLAFAVALEAYTTNDSAGVLDAILISPRRL